MEKKITEYIVVYEEYRQRDSPRHTWFGEFSEVIEEQMRRGWEPIGGVHIMDGNSSMKLGQAMVRRG